MRFLVKAWPENEAQCDDWNGDVLLELNVPTIRRLLDQRELFQMAHTRDGSLTEMVFWTDAPVHYFDEMQGILRDDEEIHFLNERERELYGSESFLRIPDERAIDKDELECHDFADPTEDDRILVTEMGVRFTAMLTNHNVLVGTVCIPFNTLLDAMLELLGNSPGVVTGRVRCTQETA